MQLTNSNKRPVILQVLPELRSGGIERGTIDVARGITKAGGKALIASAGGPMLSQLSSIKATHFTLPLKSKNPITIWRNARRLAKLIVQQEVDIVHARSRAPAWSAWLAAKKTGRPFITTFHGIYGLQSELKRKYNSIMTRGERVIAISSFVAEHIQKNYGMPLEKIRVIHRGVDLKLFNPQNYSQSRMITLTQEWRLPEDWPLILFPGRVTRWKGQDIFVKALAKLPHRRFFAVLLGDDKGHEHYRHQLERLIVHLGLEGHVRLARHTMHIPEAYRMARLVVATSTEPEAFGRVVVEAQAMGRPIITTAHGGPMETVVPEVTGWLVPPGDVDALASTINDALDLDDNILQWMGEQAMINAQQFSMDRMCEETLAVYQELLQSTSPYAEASPDG